MFSFKRISPTCSVAEKTGSYSGLFFICTTSRSVISFSVEITGYHWWSVMYVPPASSGDGASLRLMCEVWPCTRVELSTMLHGCISCAALTPRCGRHFHPLSAHTRACACLHYTHTHTHTHHYQISATRFSLPGKPSGCSGLDIFHLLTAFYRNNLMPRLWSLKHFSSHVVIKFLSVVFAAMRGTSAFSRLIQRPIQMLAEWAADILYQRLCVNI